MKEIKQLDIVEIISRYVELKNYGNNFKGLCPFHGEKTPSFTVNPEKGSFYCFGCHLKGDVVDFIKRLNNCSFKDALKILGIKPGYVSQKDIVKRNNDRQKKQDFDNWMIKADCVLSGALFNIDFIINSIETEAGLEFWGFLYHRKEKYEYWRGIISKGNKEQKKAFYNENKYLSDIFDRYLYPKKIEQGRVAASFNPDPEYLKVMWD